MDVCACVCVWWLCAARIYVRAGVRVHTRARARYESACGRSAIAFCEYVQGDGGVSERERKRELRE